MSFFDAVRVIFVLHYLIAISGAYLCAAIGVIPDILDNWRGSFHIRWDNGFADQPA
jgi:hypothetical protein